MEQHKQKILAAIANRGWFTTEIYQIAAQELYAAGVIRRDTRHSVGGNPKSVWVKAA